jgi:predicted  nucleic acid-binding Zn-ribbon protein
MTKPADDKLAQAKREIKALTGQLAEAKEHLERLEFCLSGQESISELLESLTESDGKLISKLQEKIEEMSQAIDLALTDCHVGGNVTPKTLNIFEAVMKKVRGNT